MASNSTARVLRGQPTHACELARALRALAIDAVKQANSGHPGAPMGMAELAVALWCGHLKHNPGNPRWADRDRFVLSNGHASMLVYALLHLSGYDLPSSTVFDRQDRDWRDSVLGLGLPHVGVEAGVSRWWGQYGCVAALGVDGFGESAPAAEVYRHFGLTADALAALVREHADEDRRFPRSSN